METIVIITASIITIGWLIVFSFIATRVPWFCRGREEREVGKTNSCTKILWFVYSWFHRTFIYINFVCA